MLVIYLCYQFVYILLTVIESLENTAMRYTVSTLVTALLLFRDSSHQIKFLIWLQIHQECHTVGQCKQSCYCSNIPQIVFVKSMLLQVFYFTFCQRLTAAQIHGDIQNGALSVVEISCFPICSNLHRRKRTFTG